MIRLILIFLVCSAPLHASILFLNSTPVGADVLVAPEKGRTRRLGKTPFRMEFTNSITIIIQTEGHIPRTNTYNPSKMVFDEKIILEPLSFTAVFPENQGVVLVNGRNYSSLDGSISLPYGIYDASYNKKRQMFTLNAKSPYSPYIGVFATTLVVSLGMVIGGAVGSPIFQARVDAATDFDEAVNNLATSATLDNVMWTGVGIGTGSLIGLSIFSYYEARERRRIRRFNAKSLDYTVSTDLIDFNTILNGVQNNEAQLSAFIRNYADKKSPYIPQVYLKRAQLYVETGQTNAAIRDIQSIMRDYPTIEAYESAARLLGDIYTGQKNWLQAYTSYKSALYPGLSYADTYARMIASLAEAAETTPSFQNVLREEATKGIKDSNLRDKSFLRPYLK
ncbi:MAG: tetratricopeptide repeat protein [Brevinema sp.]